MLYMVEMNLIDGSQLDAWNAWYAGHLRMLLSLPGFRSAQRFRSTVDTDSPYLAVYGIADAAVMTSPAYRANAGPGSTGVWGARMENWHRNMMSGLDAAPEVAPEGWLALLDRRAASAPPLQAGYAALQPHGLDRTVAERGVRVGTAGEAPPAPQAHADWNLRVFMPLTPRMLPHPA